MKRAVVYVMPIKYPNRRAHTIQVTRTIHALSEHENVYLVVHRPTRNDGERRDPIVEMRKLLGVETRKTLRVIEVPKVFLSGRGFLLGLLWIALRVHRPMLFYCRRYPMADRLLRTRWLHRCPVVFESHKQPGTVGAATGQPKELIERVYRDADGLVFLHPGALEEFGARRKGTAVHAWYGIDPARVRLGGERPGELVYCGSLRAEKFGLLPEALAKLGGHVRLDVYGGTAEQIQAWKDRAAQLQVEERIRFHGHVPYPELCEQLPAYRLGLTAREGIKVIDYLEAGLTPVLPRIAVNAAVLSEDEGVFYEPGDPADLARAIEAALAREPGKAQLSEAVERLSIARRVEALRGLFAQVS